MYRIPVAHSGQGFSARSLSGAFPRDNESPRAVDGLPPGNSTLRRRDDESPVSHQLNTRETETGPGPACQGPVTSSLIQSGYEPGPNPPTPARGLPGRSFIHSPGIRERTTRRFNMVQSSCQQHDRGPLPHCTDPLPGKGVVQEATESSHGLARTGWKTRFSKGWVLIPWHHDGINLLGGVATDANSLSVGSR